jgi:MoxR-like ATPase
MKKRFLIKTHVGFVGTEEEEEVEVEYADDEDLASQLDDLVKWAWEEKTQNVEAWYEEIEEDSK